MQPSAALARVLRARPGRAASDLGGARRGRARPGRRGARAASPSEPEDADASPTTADAADPRRRRRPAQRRQVDADQHLARRGAPDRLRPARHDARRDRGRRSSATASSYDADRHRRPAPARQGVRGDREVLGGQDAAGDRRRQRRAAAARRDAGRSPTRTRTSPATSSKAGRAVVVAVNKWDAVDDYQRETLAARDRAQAGLPALCAACTSSRR